LANPQRNPLILIWLECMATGSSRT